MGTTWDLAKLRSSAGEVAPAAQANVRPAEET